MISFVLPLYNAESYILHCLRSLVQSKVDAEIIVVNDGSTDKSLELVQRYAKDKENFKIFSGENRGVAAARNLGLNAATGDYVFFLDSDDLVDIENILTLHKYAVDNQLDIVQGQAVKFWLAVEHDSEIYRRVKKRIHGKITSGDEYFSRAVKSKEFPVTVWSNIYRKEFLLDNDLYFYSGIIHEDDEWVPKTFILAGRVAFLNRVILHYRQSENSICRDGNIFLNEKSLPSFLVVVEKYCTGDVARLLKEKYFKAWRLSLYRLYIDGLKRVKFTKDHQCPYRLERKDIDKRFRKHLGWMYYMPRLIRYRWRAR